MDRRVRRWVGVHDDPSARDLPGAARAELLALLSDDRARTLGRIAGLRRDFDDIVERSSDASRDDEHDPEGATIAFERAQVAALLAAARTQLADVDLAEERVRRGVHGDCEACGRSIPRERHRVRPTVRTCVTCAAAAT
jgi:DnaK suppressor protein